MAWHSVFALDLEIDDFTIAPICLHGILSLADTPQVQVQKWDNLMATFGSGTKYSLTPFVFFDTVTLQEAISSCIFNILIPYHIHL